MTPAGVVAIKNIKSAMARKRILLLDGGAQLGVYQFAVLEQFLESGIGPSYFDHYICTSSGAFNAAYFLSEQPAEGKTIWMKYFPEVFWKLFSNDMVALENILRNIEPLDCDKVKNHSRKIIGAITGHDQLAKARELEPEAEIWAIMLKPRGYRLSSWAWKLISLFAIGNPVGRQLLADWPRIRNTFFAQIESDPSLKVIRPKKLLPISFRSKNKKLIAETYELGKNDACEFLKNENIKI